MASKLNHKFKDNKFGKFEKFESIDEKFRNLLDFKNEEEREEFSRGDGLQQLVNLVDKDTLRSYMETNLPKEKPTIYAYRDNSDRGSLAVIASSFREAVLKFDDYIYKDEMPYRSDPTSIIMNSLEPALENIWEQREIPTIESVSLEISDILRYGDMVDGHIEALYSIEPIKFG